MRYGRQCALRQIGLQGQRALQQARVLLVGVGGLGCPALQYLVGAGVGEIHLLDADTIECSNLQRQVLFTEADIGQPKVVVAQQRISALNSDCHVVAHECTLDENNVQAYLEPVDLVLDCTDNLRATYCLNDAAYRLAKPLVAASVQQFKAQWALYYTPKTPCLRCIFPAREQMPLPTCEEAGILGAVAGVVGAWQAQLAIRCLVNMEQTTDGQWFMLDVWNNRLHTYTMIKDEACALCAGHSHLPLVYPQINRDDDYQMSWRAFTSHPQREQFCLIDVREPEEHQAGNKGGVNIPLKTVLNGCADLKPQECYLLYCQRGHRSRQAVHYLRQQGFKKVYYLQQTG